ncbi:MAG: AAA family ATPase [Streptosporangiaceae bacterium]|nr:AAA family ATPase [Streptosporangiaceae bacterium]
MLQGRQIQQAVIEELLGQARAGASGALVLRGEPGIGKTALLDYAADRATSQMPVLRAIGIESEAELPFAGLHQLVRPALDRLGALPGPQSAALAAAFGLAHTAGSGLTSAGDRFLVGVGALSLLAEIAPVLCLIDDAHWLDRASVEAMLFAARRLHRDGIVMIFTSRDYPGAFPARGITDVPVPGLDAAAASALLADRDVALPPWQRDQLIAATRGNPLALIELSDHGVISKPNTVAAPVPVTSRVIDAFGHQIRSLPGAARAGLLIAAADDTGDLALLHRAGLDPGELQPAEEQGLVSIIGGTLEFRHPLIRAAAYHGATHSQRQAAHRALAVACTGPDQADRRAWHLSVATTAPDENVAAELDRAGARAVGRNGHAAATAAYQRAAQLSEDATAATRRLVQAAEAALDDGQHQTARELADRADRDPVDTALTVRLLQVRALADVADGIMLGAYERDLAGAAMIAGSDPAQALWMLMEAHQEIRQAPYDHERIAATVRLLDSLPSDYGRRPLGWLIRWNAASVLGLDTTGYPSLGETIARVRDSAVATGPRALMITAAAACLAGRDDAMRDIGQALVDEARARGSIGLLPLGLSQQSWPDTMLGNYRDARIGAAEGRQLALDLGQPFWADWMCGTLAYLAAIEGDEHACRDYAGQVHAATEQSAAAAPWAEAALIVLDLGYGRVAESLARMQAAATGPAWHHPNITRMAPDLVEAAVRLGQLSQAAEAADRFSRWAPLVGQPWAAALHARCQALIASDADTERHYERALNLHDQDTRPFDQARTQLLYGEWLRRERRKRDARVQLLASLQTFDTLGARPWANRARTELTATGTAAPHPVAPDLLTALTPQELQITRLAARGLANRDIAAQLFLSPRTVAYHLYKAYPKLGISSRAQLPALV